MVLWYSSHRQVSISTMYPPIDKLDYRWRIYLLPMGYTTVEVNYQDYYYLLSQPISTKFCYLPCYLQIYIGIAFPHGLLNHVLYNHAKSS